MSPFFTGIGHVYSHTELSFSHTSSAPAARHTEDVLHMQQSRTASKVRGTPIFTRLKVRCYIPTAARGHPPNGIV